MKKELQKTINGLKMPYKRNGEPNVLFIPVMILTLFGFVIAVSIILVSLFVNISSILFVSSIFYLLIFGIICCGYIFGTDKANKENHELLEREIAEIKGVEDIPAIIKKARNMYSKVVTENPELPFYMLSVKDIEDFLLLQNKKIVEIDIPNRQLKYEDDNGDIVKFHICGQIIENTKVNEIKMVLTNELKWKVLIPYKDNFIKDEA